VLPILFGLTNDLTGVWQSCFMLLLATSLAALIWMHLAIRQMERAAAGVAAEKLPELPEMQEIHEPKHVGVLGPHLITDWRPEDREFWHTKGRAKPLVPLRHELPRHGHHHLRVPGRPFAGPRRDLVRNRRCPSLRPAVSGGPIADRLRLDAAASLTRGSSPWLTRPWSRRWVRWP
jgi:hypothetical protein